MKPIIASPTACILVSIVRSNDAALIKVTIGRQHSKQRYTVTVGVLPPTSVEVCNYIVSVFTIAPFVECGAGGGGAGLESYFTCVIPAPTQSLHTKAVRRCGLRGWRRAWRRSCPYRTISGA